MPISPTFAQYKTILEFGTDLLDYYDIMNATQCFINKLAQSLFLLDQLQLNGVQVDTFIDCLKALNENKDLSHDICLGELVLYITDIWSAPTTCALTIHRT